MLNPGPCVHAYVRAGGGRGGDYVMTQNEGLTRTCVCVKILL